MFITSQDGKGSYNPCYIWDVDYSTAALSGHNNVSRACTQWQFDSTEFGETITEKVSSRTIHLKELFDVFIFNLVHEFYTKICVTYLLLVLLILQNTFLKRNISFSRIANHTKIGTLHRSIDPSLYNAK